MANPGMTSGSAGPLYANHGVQVVCEVSWVLGRVEHVTQILLSSSGPVKFLLRASNWGDYIGSPIYLDRSPLVLPFPGGFPIPENGTLMVEVYGDDRRGHDAHATIWTASGKPESPWMISR